MYLQPGTEVIYHLLKLPSVRHLNVYIYIEVIRRQNPLCRALPGKSQNISSGIAHIVAFHNSRQGKFRRIIIGIHYNPVTQGFGKG